mmetsp:Transcript_75324/g.156920  ORF Transcript_75324/g.156920 Transcript_75324/m.156920 type:complete len:86 (+) Transcript_75324:139-396(+)
MVLPQQGHSSWLAINGSVFFALASQSIDRTICTFAHSGNKNTRPQRLASSPHALPRPFRILPDPVIIVSKTPILCVFSFVFGPPG